MNLVNEISRNFWKWRYKVLDEDTTMYSRQFSDNTHHQLKSNFHSAFNCFVEGDKTTVVNCFSSYSSIVILLSTRRLYKLGKPQHTPPSKAVESRNAIRPYNSEITRAESRE